MDKQTFVRLARAATLAALGLAIALGPVASPAPVAAKGNFYFDFEESVEPFKATGQGSDSVRTLERRQGDSVCNDPPVNNYAVLAAKNLVTLGPAEPDVPLPVGTWMGADFEAAPGPHLVEVVFWARNEIGCEGCFPALYAGASAPQHITQFEDVSESKYLKDFWQEYRYKMTVDLPQGTENIHVAFGWAGTQAAVGYDCMRIDLKPAP
jgi:hypothetical protein